MCISIKKFGATSSTTKRNVTEEFVSPKKFPKSHISTCKTAGNDISGSLDPKETIKFSVDVISLLGHTSQDASSIRRQKVNATLNGRCAPICELNYTYCSSKIFFGDDISKSFHNSREIT